MGELCAIGASAVSALPREEPSALQLWVTGLGILEQRAPYAHDLHGCGLYEGQLRLRKCLSLRREIVLGQSSLQRLAVLWLDLIHPRPPWGRSTAIGIRGSGQLVLEMNPLETLVLLTGRLYRLISKAVLGDGDPPLYVSRYHFRLRHSTACLGPCLVDFKPSIV